MKNLRAGRLRAGVKNLHGRVEETMDERERQKELTALLDQAARAYYQESRELMSNKEYDELYDELAALEKKSGIVLAGSPTARPGYEVVSSLPKEEHPQKMLSLDKTKDVEALAAFLGSQKGLLSWKLDGLTVVLTYRSGRLFKAVTRGNGQVGEVVTPNARQFINLPARIPFTGELVLRGEAVISYADFERINEEIPETEAKYKNPRNLCAGSVRQLSSEITARRSVRFMAFALVSASAGTAGDGEAVSSGVSEENGGAAAEGVREPDFENSREKQFEWLKRQGFSVVPYRVTDAAGLAGNVKAFAEEIENYELPSDGLVLLMDDIAYGESLGATAKFPRNAMAFKWKDETQQTILKNVLWNPSRTGLINPIAVFDPVELEGTTVSRASVHNVSIVRELKLGIGDEITVYKANMIIPQIAENLTGSASLVIPDRCPVCGGSAAVKDNDGIQVLMCENPDCPAKQIKAFDLFVSRGAMNIDGLSEMTLEKMIDSGFVKEFADLYHLDRYKEEICAMEGFGEKSFSNLMDSINRSRSVSVASLLAALGIPGIGSANAALIARAFGQDIDAVRKADRQTLEEIDKIGPVLADGIVSWFADEGKAAMLDRLLSELTIVKEESSAPAVLEGLTFVITGSVEHFANRNALKAWIEERGGKVAGSVSAKTSYLINNDAGSNSTKNRKARELGVKVITEEELLGYGAI